MVGEAFVGWKMGEAEICHHHHQRGAGNRGGVDAIWGKKGFWLRGHK